MNPHSYSGVDAFAAWCKRLAKEGSSYPPTRIEEIAFLEGFEAALGTLGECTLEARRHLEGKTGVEFIEGWNALRIATRSSS